jgi:hypothetical protein
MNCKRLASTLNEPCRVPDPLGFPKATSFKSTRAPMHNVLNYHSDELDHVNLCESWEAEYWLRSLACTCEEWTTQCKRLAPLQRTSGPSFEGKRRFEGFASWPTRSRSIRARRPKHCISILPASDQAHRRQAIRARGQSARSRRFLRAPCGVRPTLPLNPKQSQNLDATWQAPGRPRTAVRKCRLLLAGRRSDMIQERR